MIASIFSIIVPLAQIFLLWKIWRTLQPIADTEEKKAELNETIKKFGAMFAAASMEVPKPPPKKKVVSFTAADE